MEFLTTLCALYSFINANILKETSSGWGRTGGFFWGGGINWYLGLGES